VVLFAWCKELTVHTMHVHNLLFSSERFMFNLIPSSKLSVVKRHLIINLVFYHKMLLTNNNCRPSVPFHSISCRAHNDRGYRANNSATPTSLVDNNNYTNYTSTEGYFEYKRGTLHSEIIVIIIIIIIIIIRPWHIAL